MRSRETRVRQIQEELFFPPAEKPNSDSVEAVLGYLREQQALASFEISIIGSLLYSPGTSHDVDLLLTLRPPTTFHAEEVEQALLRCIRIGREVAAVRIDPTFRSRSSDSRTAGWLRSSRRLACLKVEDPRSSFRLAMGPCPDTARIGRFSVVHTAAAGDLPFFAKLQPHPSEPASRWLAPSVPLDEYLQQGESP